ncbi:YbjN domain-containing protein [Qipengyuania sp. JC766]|uniref:YbjN domain-containing protein n=1 Tax=Qipengyuania sp. JC766 TaxID=3232139 RepID=UPI003457D7F5
MKFPLALILSAALGLPLAATAHAQSTDAQTLSARPYDPGARMLDFDGVDGAAVLAQLVIQTESRQGPLQVVRLPNNLRAGLLYEDCDATGTGCSGLRSFASWVRPQAIPAEAMGGLVNRFNSRAGFATAYYNELDDQLYLSRTMSAAGGISQQSYADELNRFVQASSQFDRYLLDLSNQAAAAQAPADASPQE